MENSAPEASSKIFVRYKKADPSEDEMRAIFSKHGTIAELKLYSRFCFIEFESESSAAAAVQAENGTMFKNVALEVETVVRDISKRKADDTEKSDVTSAAPSTSEEPSAKVSKQDTTVKPVKETDKSKETKADKTVRSETQRPTKVLPINTKSVVTPMKAALLRQKVKEMKQVQAAVEKEKELKNNKARREAAVDFDVVLSKSAEILSRMRSEIPGSVDSLDKSTSRAKDSSKSASSGNSSGAVSKKYKKSHKDPRSETLRRADSPDDAQSFAAAIMNHSNQWPQSYPPNFPLASTPTYSHGYRAESPKISASNPSHLDSVSSEKNYVQSSVPSREQVITQCLNELRNAPGEYLHSKIQESVLKASKDGSIWSELSSLGSLKKFSQGTVPEYPPQERIDSQERREQQERRELQERREAQERRDQISAEKFSRIADVRRASSPEAYHPSKPTETIRPQPRSLESAGHPESEPQRDSAADLGICEIVVTEPRLRYYALQVASRIHSVGLKVEICDLPSANSTIDEVEDAMARGCLFAVVITEMHAERNSVTVDILHGVPEEHRNMMVDEAIELIRSSFHKYISAKQKPTSKPDIKSPEILAKLPSSKPSLPLPSRSTQMLIERLAKYDGLTYDELEDIVMYLRQCQKAAVMASKPDRVSVARSKDLLDISAKQRELETSILGIIKGSSLSPQQQEVLRQTVNSSAMYERHKEH